MTLSSSLIQPTRRAGCAWAEGLLEVKKPYASPSAPVLTCSKQALHCEQERRLEAGMRAAP